MDIISETYRRMVNYDSGDPKRIQHFVKVHSFARWIGINEKISEEEQFILEVAALTHDIGIKPALEKYGSSAGPLQEKEGAAAVVDLLGDMPLSKEVLERVQYLIGHHHTYNSIDGIDYQILVEADFLVNLYEGQQSRENIEICLNKIFKTESGKELLQKMFL